MIRRGYPLDESAIGGENPSVVGAMAAYKPDYLAESIASAVAQTHALDRLVVVVDGPRDTLSVAESAASQYDIVHVVHQENQGIAVARGRAIELAVGDIALGVKPDFVTVFDDDDLVAPTFIEELLGILRSADPDVIASYCGVEIIDENGAKIGSSAELLGARADRLYRSTDFNRYLGQESVPDSLTSTMFRADLFRGDTALKFDPRLRLVSDFALILASLYQGGRMLGTSEPLLKYRRHGGQVTHDRSDTWRELPALWQHYVPLMSKPEERSKAYKLLGHWAEVHGQPEVAAYLSYVARKLSRSPEMPIPAYEYQTPQVWHPDNL